MCSVLIADDDLASCLILRKMITDLGFECDIVSNGAEAVQASVNKFYDLYFLDLIMPVLSGIHAAIAIRSLTADSPRKPLIVGVASSADCEASKLCKQAGMAGLLLKPFHRESIVRLLVTLRLEAIESPIDRSAHCSTSSADRFPAQERHQHQKTSSTIPPNRFSRRTSCLMRSPSAPFHPSRQIIARAVATAAARAKRIVNKPIARSPASIKRMVALRILAKRARIIPHREDYPDCTIGSKSSKCTKLDD